MSWKSYLLISVVGLAVIGGFAWFQSAPGYMDAEYYYSMGLRIANEGTWREPFIWNYLNSPASLEQPGFQFWMPLPALISAAGIFLFGAGSFWGAKSLFLVLAAAVPALVMALAWTWTGERETAWLSGLFAVFPFLYAPFLGTSDSFAAMMVLGSLYFLLLQRSADWRTLGLGLICGLIHLARADGAIWLAAAAAAIVLGSGKKWQQLAGLLGGYLIVMLPWFARNWMAIGQIMPPSSGRMLWLTAYDDLFNLDPAGLTMERWLSQGPTSIAAGIASALGTNLQTLFIVQGEILLGPLLILGLARERKNPAAWTALLIWGLTLLVMTVVFPFAGERGGYFHSGAGLQPVIWVLAARGFSVFVAWGVENRSWIETRAKTLFAAALLVFLAVFTGYVFKNRVVGHDFGQPAWNESFQAHLEIARELDGFDQGSTFPVMLNNPPGYYAAAGRSAVVIPNGPIADLKLAAARYRVRYLILEANHPQALDGLYADPDQEEELLYLGTVDGRSYFRFPE